MFINEVQITDEHGQIYKKLIPTNDENSRGKNMVPVQLKFNQRILVPFCRHLSLMQSHSNDDGITVSSPEKISNIVQSEWKTVALGSPKCSFTSIKSNFSSG